MTISLPQDLAEQIEAQAKANGVNRSKFTRWALSEFLIQPEPPKPSEPDAACSISLRVTPAQLEWIDSRGKRSEVVRNIIAALMGVLK
jgi:metal-responsive CopG/Arc/MetJ family transcriptional regulator